MFRIVRTRTLAMLHEESTRAGSFEAEVLSVRADMADLVLESTERLKRAAEECDEVRAEAEAAGRRADAALAQVLLDAEDRVALRVLLRTVRKQSRILDRVYVLFQHGRLHSVHISQEAAESAAENEGAPRKGWTSHKPGDAMPPADQVTWRVQPLPLGGSQ